MKPRGWEPTSSFEEKLKEVLVPPRLYAWFRARRERARGEREIRLLPVLVEPARNAVDAGANKGVYSTWMARTARHVYAYEPNPKLYRQLIRSMGRKVTVSPAALSDENGEAALRIPQSAKGHSNQRASLSADAVASSFDAVAVETRRLDDEGLSDIGFIKVDVEGFEYEMLKGAAATIACDRPILLVEIEEIHTKLPIVEAVRRIEREFAMRAYFTLHGRLHPIAALDPARHHDRTRPRENYVFNFLFFPAERPEAAFSDGLRALLDD